MKNYLPQLDVLDTACEVDDTGFTDLEKVTLQNAWKLIKPKIKNHAWEIYLKVFYEFEYLIDTFRNSDGIINTESMVKHTYYFLKTIENLIEVGLYDKIEMNFTLAKVAQLHSDVDAPKEHFMIIINGVNQHFKEFLKIYSSPTLINSLDKICRLIADAGNWRPPDPKPEDIVIVGKHERISSQGETKKSTVSMINNQED